MVKAVPIKLRAAREPLNLQLDPDSIIRALDIDMPCISCPPNREMAEGTFDTAPFRSAELSYRSDLGSGTLLLRAHSETSLLDWDLDLGRLGPRPTPIPELSGQGHDLLCWGID